MNSIRHTSFLRLLLLGLLCLFGHTVYAIDSHEPAYEHEIKVASYPDKLFGREVFSLYTFHFNEFDPQKQSILFIEGGPGIPTNREHAYALQQSLANYNLIFFDSRGAGRSAMPARSDFALSLKSEYVAQDIESIRKYFKIAKWDSLIASCYGSIPAIIYSQKYPAYLQKIVYEAGFTPPALLNPSWAKKESEAVLNLKLVNALKQLDIESEKLEEIENSLIRNKQSIEHFLDTKGVSPMLTQSFERRIHEFGEIFGNHLSTHKDALLIMAKDFVQIAYNKTVSPSHTTNHSSNFNREFFLTANRHFLENDKKYFLKPDLLSYSVPSIFLHGNLDARVSIETTKSFFQVSNNPQNRFLEFKEHGHEALTSIVDSYTLNEIMKGHWPHLDAIVSENMGVKIHKPKSIRCEQSFDNHYF